MTKREKRLQDLRRKIARLERDRDLGIKLLVKAVTTLPTLRKQEARLISTILRAPGAGADIAVHPVPRPSEHVLEDGSAPDDDAVVENDTGAEPLRGNANDDHEDIPTFLLADQEARAQVQREADAEKKRKAEVAAQKRAIKKEVTQADLTGARRRMPLSGRAALDALRK